MPIVAGQSAKLRMFDPANVEDQRAGIDGRELRRSSLPAPLTGECVFDPDGAEAYW